MEPFCEFFNSEEDKPEEKDCYNIESINSNFSDSLYNFSRDKLPPEPEHGNVEYKLKLVNPSSQRFEHLVTQMKWRLKEGHGEAIYQIGVEDNGKLTGLSYNDMTASLKTLSNMAAKLGATTTLLRERSITVHTSNFNNQNSFSKKDESNITEIHNEKKVAEVLVRKLRKNDIQQENVIDLRIAVMGSQDAGKSTLLGVLTQGELDNGRGRSRLNMLRHLHEIKTGRTSSISHEIIGFDNDGHVLNYAKMITAEEICEHASKVVTLIDLAGHRKYLKTTLLGLTGYSPHYVMLIVAPPVNEAVQEHMALCLALCLPFFVVITKIDLGHYDLLKIISQLKNVAKILDYDNEFVLHGHLNSNCQINVNSTTVFTVSCVTGEGIDDLTNYIKDLSAIAAVPSDVDPDSCLFQIDETFRVVGSTKPVLGGLLVKGEISLGSKLLMGPSIQGTFYPVKIASLHRNKTPCKFVKASQSASLTLTPVTERDFTLPPVRSGMVLVSLQEKPYATLFFQATVIVVYHATAIYPGFQATIHAGNIRQTCIIEGIMDLKENGLKTKESASVLFRFLRHPEYLHVRMGLLLREGRTKLIGKITQIFPINCSTL